MDTPQKAGDKCNHCKLGNLIVSPSGDHLMCRNCGHITLLKKLRLPRGRKRRNINSN